jgi:NADH-quinone oxidoreductase subunit L
MDPVFILIPLLPLAGFLLNGLVGRRLGVRVAGFLGCATVAGSFVLSLLAWRELLGLPEGERALAVPVYTWIASGDFSASFGLLIDPLSVTMMLVVSGVGFLIHVYSVGYMHGDAGFARYFAYLNLFTFAMLILVMADNLLLMFVGWEGVGLCSYLLIGFWYKEHEPPRAGMKAFIVNRIGDFGFALGMFLLFTAFGTIAFEPLREKILHTEAPQLLLWGTSYGTYAVLTAAALLLFVGAAGKSAQIPLYVWLPDAMAGPTPVSALIHAATMVTAGVYMVSRMGFLYTASPCALGVVASVGAVTAFFAATMALVQDDIKKVLAYSTISQLGYMFLACGAGAYAAGIFHLVTHAFFKALLFLAAGSVIHAMAGEQNIFKMGGLRSRMPATHATFLLGALAIAGVPPLAGFFSKDGILARTYEQSGMALWLLGAATAAMTAFYMFRLYFLVFAGKSRVESEKAAHLHESPKVMTVPLMILAALSVVGGWMGIPHLLGGHDRFGEWLHEWGGAHETLLSHGTEWALMAVSVAAAAIGIFVAWRLALVSPGAAARLAEGFGPVYRILFHKYYIDEIYDAAVIRPFVRLSEKFWKGVDEFFVDGTLVGTGTVTEWLGYALALLQTGAVRHYLLGIFLGALFLMTMLTGVSPVFDWYVQGAQTLFTRALGTISGGG